ncbi:MAG: hypothetical protein OTI35_16310 [Sulfitobacter sp.]|nr:hypothetical protein [Sulfitobacter sp.]
MCNCGPIDAEDPEDTELRILFQDLALTLFDLMDPDDAYILACFELRDEALSEVAAHFRCSETEANGHLIRAQRSFCQLVVLTLASAESE